MYACDAECACEVLCIAVLVNSIQSASVLHCAMHQPSQRYLIGTQPVQVPKHHILIPKTQPVQEPKHHILIPRSQNPHFWPQNRTHACGCATTPADCPLPPASPPTPPFRSSRAWCWTGRTRTTRSQTGRSSKCRYQRPPSCLLLAVRCKPLRSAEAPVPL